MWLYNWLAVILILFTILIGKYVAQKEKPGGDLLTGAIGMLAVGALPQLYLWGIVSAIVYAAAHQSLSWRSLAVYVVIGAALSSLMYLISRLLMAMDRRMDEIEEHEL